MKKTPKRITSMAVAATMLLPLSGCTIKTNNHNNDDTNVSKVKDDYDKEVDKKIISLVIPDNFFDILFNPKSYKYDYIVNLDELVENNTSKPTLMASLLVDKTYSNQKKLDGKITPLPEWFNSIDQMIIIPKEYSWIDANSFFFFLDKEVRISLYRVENGIYYACYNITYTFNDLVKQISLPASETYKVPKVGDKIYVNRVNAIIYSHYNNEIQTIAVSNNEFGDFNSDQEINDQCFGNPKAISKIEADTNILIRKKDK